MPFQCVCNIHFVISGASNKHLLEIIILIEYRNSLRKIVRSLDVTILDQ